MKNKKSKCKTYYKVNKEKLQKISKEYYRNSSKDEKIKKRNYGYIRKKMSDTDGETKKNI